MITDEELLRIIAEIYSHIKKYDIQNDNHNWYAGITNNASKKEKYLKKYNNVVFFKYWDLRDKSTAQNVEIYLHENGFKKSKNGITYKSSFFRLFANSTIVYVFKNE